MTSDHCSFLWLPNHPLLFFFFLDYGYLSLLVLKLLIVLSSFSHLCLRIKGFLSVPVRNVVLVYYVSAFCKFCYSLLDNKPNLAEMSTPLEPSTFLGCCRSSRQLLFQQRSGQNQKSPLICVPKKLGSNFRKGQC
ncbi:hypothetical protein VIGAN_02071600 [Vigna angularis var. angularis]|uniref:Uncharacterized protein n=1 Tax=Vigna angularis var. angularis TaxID=157739 RepID=A0A0S3RCE8_PHAAN|nr:hypothetical protein VIGAN_02071600 [Vigna angularis var. angularis]